MPSKKSSAEEILDKQFERKPRKRITKKEEKKIIDDTKPKEEIEKTIKKLEHIEPIKPLIVDYEMKRTTKFDLNWFFIKKRFVDFEKWISAPYTKAYWRKHGFKEKEKVIKPIVEKPMPIQNLTPEQLNYLKFYYEDKKRDNELLFRSEK